MRFIIPSKKIRTSILIFLLLITLALVGILSTVEYGVVGFISVVKMSLPRLLMLMKVSIFSFTTTLQSVPHVNTYVIMFS